MMDEAWSEHRPVPTDHEGPVDIVHDPIKPEQVDRSPIERFDYIVERHGERLAVDDGETRLSYRELQHAARALACRIDALAPQGAPVLAVLRYTALVPIALLASIAAGRPIIPVDATYPVARQRMIMDNAGAAIVLVETGATLEAQLPDLPVLEADLADLLSSSVSGWPEVAYDPEGLGGVIFSSGSTGNPKGLAWSLGAIMRMIAEKTDMTHLNPDDKLIALASHSAAGLGDVLYAVLNGASLRILDVMKAGLNEALRVLGDEGITIFNFVPTVLRTVLAMDGAAHAFRHLRILELYGDATLAEDVDFFREKLPDDCHISTVFGSTESAVLFTWFVPRNFRADGPNLPIGYLARHKSVRIIDADGTAVPAGSEGELIVRSRKMALGAWQDGRITPGLFLPDPQDPKSQIYAMGDVVAQRADGLYEFRGRKDRMVKVRGMRADLAEVEAALRQHPAIADVAVVAVSQADDNELVAYCVAKNGAAQPQRAEMRRLVSDATAPHMVPAQFEFIAAIPRLPNYKPDLVSLARLSKAG